MLFPVSDCCQAEVVTILDRKVQIINTSKIFDYKDRQLVEELSHVLTLARNGIHALAFVLNLKEDMSPLHQNAIDRLLKCKGLQPFTFVLWTNVEQNDVCSADARIYFERNLLPNKIYPDCFKKIVEFADFRAIMVESGDQTHTANYQQRKAKEFIKMIEMISRNGSEKYMNSYLDYAARTYEKAQNLKLRQINKVLGPNQDRIKQLHSQLMTKNYRIYHYLIV